MGGAARHRDVPARQPGRFGLLRLHLGVVLRGAEAFAGADRVPAPLPPASGADPPGTAQRALRIRSGAGARNADAAFLRRSAPEPLVPVRRGMAYGTGDLPHLPAAVAGRGTARRGLPALHEEASGRTGRRSEEHTSELQS